MHNIPSDKRYLTQWTSQFLVAAELCRRGYTTSFTMGNSTPYADLAVGKPDGALFWVDVKGNSTGSDWWLKRKASINSLYYILVRVMGPTSGGAAKAADRFFILTQDQANRLVDEYLLTAKDGTKAEGFRFRSAAPFEDRWDILP